MVTVCLCICVPKRSLVLLIRPCLAGAVGLGAGGGSSDLQTSFSSSSVVEKPSSEGSCSKRQVSAERSNMVDAAARR